MLFPSFLSLPLSHSPHEIIVDRHLRLTEVTICVKLFPLCLGFLWQFFIWFEVEIVWKVISRLLVNGSGNGSFPSFLLLLYQSDSGKEKFTISFPPNLSISAQIPPRTAFSLFCRLKRHLALKITSIRVDKLQMRFKSPCGTVFVLSSFIFHHHGPISNQIRRQEMMWKGSADKTERGEEAKQCHYHNR